MLNFSTIRKYLDHSDWRINENSNMGYSLQGLNNHIVQEVVENFWLDGVYTKSIKQAHVSGALYIHDLGLLSSYCSGWDLLDLLTRGFCGVESKPESAPPKHFRSALAQIWNFLCTTQGEVAGAIALSNFDTLLAPFIAYEDLSYVEVKQSMQEFVYNMNVPTRVGFQCPFSNITLDLVPPSHLKNQCVIIGGELKDKKYGNFQVEMNILNKAFCEVMIEGDRKGMVFTFPIPTYSITKDFNWDLPVMKYIFKMTAKLGLPYWANYAGSNIKPEDTRSMCVSGDTKVRVKWVKTLKIEDIEISVLLENHAITEFLILTSQGYREVCRKIITTTASLLKIKLESGKVIQVTKDHPSLVYNEGGELKICSSSELRVGMEMSVKRDLSGISLIENEKDCNDCYYNCYHTSLKKEKYEFYKKNNLNTLIVNSKETNKWMRYVNAIEKIVSIEEIPYNKKVYDIEILNKEGKYQVHDFYANNILTHNCCRLRLETAQLRRGGLFSSNPLTGSLGVVTLNLPHLLYIEANTFPEKLSKKELLDSFFIKLDYYLLIAREALQIKRVAVETYMEEGLYPYSKFYLQDVKDKTGSYYKNHFSTVGVLGMHEMLLNYGLKEGICCAEGTGIASRVLDFIQNRLNEFQEQDGVLYNLEATPAEGASYRCAKVDKQRWPKILSSGVDTPFYTNSTQLPSNYEIDIFEALDQQDPLQVKYSGGTVHHIFLGEAIDDWKICRSLVRKVTENYHLPYFTITPTFSICPKHGYLKGEVEICPKCQKICNIYSRVVGYFRPIKQWNIGKKEEFRYREVDRKEFKLDVRD